MNKLFKYMAAAALVAATGLTACQDDFDAPVTEVPVATLEPNTTILELKEQMWSDSLNYCHQVGLREDGSHVVIKGRVISSDAAGNLYRTFYISDGTAALPISYNAYDICLIYRPGQEIMVDMTGLYVGKYNGMEEIGTPKWDDSRHYTTTSFMTPRFFDAATQLNGMPDAARIDTLLLKEKPLESKEVLLDMQGRLVRFNNVTFKPQSGVTTLCDAFQSSGFSQPFFLPTGTNDSINVRTSGYADFWNTPLPTGPCDVVGILGYYNNGSTKDGWQLLLIDPAGLMNVGNPTVVGDKAHPYTVAQAIEFAEANANERGWVSGYIVGTVAPEVTEVTSNSSIQWEAPFIMGNSLVIAQDSTCRDWKQCLVLELPENSMLQAAANLVDNDSLLYRHMGINGRFVSDVLGTYGVDGYQGNADEFFIDGVQLPEDPSGPVTDGDGSKEKPYNPTQVLALNNPGSTAWVKGYIVGSAPDKTADSFTTATGTSASNTNIFIATTPGETDYTKCVPVQLPAGAVRNALSLQTNPGNLGKEVAVYGSLLKYFGLPGVKETSEYELGEGGGDTPVTPPATGDDDGDGTEAAPYTATQVIGLGNPGTISWVKGYIVGSAPDKTADSFTPTAGASASNTNIFIAATPGETNYQNCVPVQLPAGDVRSALSLQAHPENLGKAVTLYGSLAKYFGMPGIKETSAYKLEDGEGGGDTPVTPPAGDGGGTQDSPYTIAQVRTLGNPGTVSWVEGYVVGSCTGQAYSSAAFTADGAAYANVLLADSPSETDASKCIPVQLVAKTDLRAAVNLGDNPGNLGRKLKVEGKLTAYFGEPGVKETSAWEFDGEGGGDTPVTPPVTGDDKGNGTEATPYTIGQIQTLGSTGAEAWVEGVIVGYVNGQILSMAATFSAEGAKATNVILAPEAGVTDPAKCTALMLPSSSADVRAALNLKDNPSNLGRTVKVKGTVSDALGATGITAPSAYKF